MKNGAVRFVWALEPPNSEEPQFATSSEFGRRILLGLAFGAAGDIALLGHGGRALAAGMGLFACGHLAYSLSGSIGGNLSKSEMRISRGEIQLYLSEELRPLMSDGITRRVEILADALKAWQEKGKK